MPHGLCRCCRYGYRRGTCGDGLLRAELEAQPPGGLLRRRPLADSPRDIFLPWGTRRMRQPGTQPCPRRSGSRCCSTGNGAPHGPRLPAASPVVAPVGHVEPGFQHHAGAVVDPDGPGNHRVAEQGAQLVRGQQGTDDGSLHLPHVAHHQGDGLPGSVLGVRHHQGDRPYEVRDGIDLNNSMLYAF